VRLLGVGAHGLVRADDFRSAADALPFESA
jgi:hypothetical protein